MVGRLIQNNPFLLSKVDNLFYNKDHTNLVNKTIVIEYFEYIKDKISNDSIFRLLSPLLSLFFGVANSKKLKSEIQANERWDKGDPGTLKGLEDYVEWTVSLGYSEAQP